MPRTMFVCTYEGCNTMFHHLERYERHLRKHTGERPFKCSYEECDKSYSCKSHLKRHEKSHEMMFKCTLPGCSKILKTIGTLTKHQNEFHKKKEAAKIYKCPECNEEFTKHSLLTRHLSIHAGVLPYKCSQSGCDKSFSAPSLLKRHIKRHVGYVCEENGCSLLFQRWSLLLKHRRECHPKIFRCNICEKVFNTSSILKAHSFTHRLDKTTYECTVPKCTRVYMSKHALSDHVKTFHSKYTIPCPKETCNRFLSNQEALEKHIRHRHTKRVRKKKPKTDFAEILAGIAKGSMKDLNPHQRDIPEDETKNDDTVSFDSTKNPDENFDDADNELNCSSLNAQGSTMQGLNPCTSSEDELDCDSSNSKKKFEKLKEDLVEIEVVLNSSENCSQSVETTMDFFRYEN